MSCCTRAFREHTRAAAVQSCPALKHLATAMSSAALDRSASSKTITGAFRPVLEVGA